MATVSYDGQSFSVDGRRVWLVSGAIHYTRVPRDLWRSRIRAAKQAGLNCIETYAFWNAHETSPGKFDFNDNLDLRHFIQLIGEEGMYCWLRPGPFIGAEWDNGGLPTWLHQEPTDRKSGPMVIRTGSAPFLAACSRYLRAVMQQVSDLQITHKVSGRPPRAPLTNAPGEAAGGFAGQGNGPILMMQAENQWVSGNDEQEVPYLQQIVRYLRENGCEVPINTCNQLWQTVDGTIHTWNASKNLAPNMRQLREVQEDAPRIVSEYKSGGFDAWGQKHADEIDAQTQLYRLACTLAAGAQYNLSMFHGGTNFGFWGGRTRGEQDRFITTSYDYDAPLLEAGGRGEKFITAKRISTFASQFGALFAHLDPARQPTVIQPTESDHPPSIIHLTGYRGDVVFVMKALNDRKTKRVQLLLPNGLTLPVHLGDDPVAWLLVNANLGNGVTVDYANLRPLAFLDGKLLIVFGPAGSEGMISINGVHLTITVPRGKSPQIDRVEDVTVVTLNTEQADAAYPFAEGIAVGCSGLDDDGEPLPLKNWATQTRISTEGETTTVKTSVTRKPPAPKLEAWTIANVADYLDGSAEAFQPIDGPTSHDQLNHPLGYGWYRLRFPASVKGKQSVIAPGSGDRLHFFRDGKPLGILGYGPGLNDGRPLSLSLGGTTTVLTDNLGRYNYGRHVGEQKGLLSDLFAIKPVTLPKPKTFDEAIEDPFKVWPFLPQHRRTDPPPAHTLRWQIKPMSRKPMVLTLDRLPVDAVIIVNGQPIEHFGNTDWPRRVILLDPADDGPFTGGMNQLDLVLYSPLPDGTDLKKHVLLDQTTANLTKSAKWAFTPWSMPGDDAFGKAKAPAGRPAWFRTTFSVNQTRVPLFVHPKAMSKGQLFLNGHNLGRYFMQTPDKKPVPPQSLYYLPEPWLLTDAPNVLTLFDEHGFAPTQCQLVYNELGPFGKG